MRRILGTCLLALLLLGLLPALSLANDAVVETKGSPQTQSETKGTPQTQSESKGTPQKQQAAEPLTEVAVRAYDATSVTVSWKPANNPVTVYLSVAGRENYYYMEADASPATVDLLAPETTYEFIVQDANTGDEHTRTVMLPAADPYREYGYRWNLCNTYVVQDGDGSVTDRRRLRSSSVTRAELKENLRGGSYVMILEASWKKSDSEKEWLDMWVMRTPDGDVYTDARINTCEPDWLSLYYFYPLSNLYEEYLSDRGDWAAGDYTFEIYFDGQFAGRAKLTLKE